MPRLGVALALTIAMVFTARPVNHPPDIRIVKTAAAASEPTPPVSINAEPAVHVEPVITVKPAETTFLRVAAVPSGATRRRPVQAADATRCSCAPAPETGTNARRLIVTTPATRPVTPHVMPTAMPQPERSEPRHPSFAWSWLLDAGPALAADRPRPMVSFQAP